MRSAYFHIYSRSTYYYSPHYTDEKTKVCLGPHTRKWSMGHPAVSVTSYSPWGVSEPFSFSNPVLIAPNRLDSVALPLLS